MQQTPGGCHRSPPAVALATLACAVAFDWIRQRVQRVVDRRFDRDHAAAAAEVSWFVNEVREGRSAPEHVDAVLRVALSDPQLAVAFALPSKDHEPLWLDVVGNRVARPAEPRSELAPGGRMLCTIGYGVRTTARPGLLRDVLRHAYPPLELARSRIEVRLALAETEASRARLVRVSHDEPAGWNATCTTARRSGLAGTGAVVGGLSGFRAEERNHELIEWPRRGCHRCAQLIS